MGRFVRGVDESDKLEEKEDSEERAGYRSILPSSDFLLGAFCFGGRVTSAEIFANSGLGSLFIPSSSGFFNNGLMVLE